MLRTQVPHGKGWCVGRTTTTAAKQMMSSVDSVPCRPMFRASVREPSGPCKRQTRRKHLAPGPELVTRLQRAAVEYRRSESRPCAARSQAYQRTLAHLTPCEPRGSEFRGGDHEAKEGARRLPPRASAGRAPDLCARSGTACTSWWRCTTRRAGSRRPLRSSTPGGSTRPAARSPTGAASGRRTAGAPLAARRELGRSTFVTLGHA